VADTGEDEVLEGGGRGGGSADDEDAGRFERSLARRCPQSTYIQSC
jgi:hypothetical protein